MWTVAKGQITVVGSGGRRAGVGNLRYAKSSPQPPPDRPTYAAAAIRTGE